MDKGILKIELIVTLIVSYFTTLLVIFCYKPMDILIANIMIWLLMIILNLGFKFVDWLDD